MEKAPENTGMPELDEPGIQEEGLFDVIKPYKVALLKKIKESVPSEEAGQLLEEAGDLLIPDSPMGINLNRASPKLKEIVQKVKFPTASEGAKVFKQAEAPTKEAFKQLPDNIQAMKRKSAIEALQKKGPPPPSTEAVPYVFPKY